MSGKKAFKVALLSVLAVMVGVNAIVLGYEGVGLLKLMSFGSGIVVTVAGSLCAIGFGIASIESKGWECGKCRSRDELLAYKDGEIKTLRQALLSAKVN